MKSILVQTLVVLWLIFINISLVFCFNDENNLIAYFPFNNSVDNVVNKNTSEVLHNISYTDDRKSIKLSACKFDNPDEKIATSYITISNTDMFNLQEATISFWFKHFENIPRNQAMVEKGYNSNAIEGKVSYIIYFYDGKLNFHVSLNRNSYTIKTDPPEKDKWHHLVALWGNCSIEGFKMSLYLDGEHIETKLFSEINDLNLVFDQSPLLFGADEDFDNNSKHYGFNGILDDIRIYNKIMINPLNPSFLNLLYDCNGSYQYGFEEGLIYAKKMCYENPSMCNINNNGLYSEQDLLDRINNILKWDVNKDKQIGLHEVIQILKDTSEASN